MENPAPQIDWSRPLELVSEGKITPVALCTEDQLPHYVDTNPDADGDFWMLLPNARSGDSRFCADVTGDAHPWGELRNVVDATAVQA